MALLIYAQSNGEVPNPGVISNWDAVHYAARHIIKSCATDMGAGGVYIIFCKLMHPQADF